MKPNYLPYFSPTANALLDSVITDILHGQVSSRTIQTARLLDELVDIDDLDFLLVLVGASQTSDFGQLNLLALEELMRYLGGGG